MNPISSSLELPVDRRWQLNHCESSDDIYRMQRALMILGKSRFSQKINTNEGRSYLILFELTNLCRRDLSKEAWAAYKRIYFWHIKEFNALQKDLDIYMKVNRLSIHINGQCIGEIPKNHFAMMSEPFRRYCDAQPFNSQFNFELNQKTYRKEDLEIFFEFMKTGILRLTKENTIHLLVLSYEFEIDELKDRVLKSMYQQCSRSRNLKKILALMQTAINLDWKQMLWCLLRSISATNSNRPESCQIDLDAIDLEKYSPSLKELILGIKGIEDCVLQEKPGALQVLTFEAISRLEFLFPYFPLTLTVKNCNLMSFDRPCPYVENLFIDMGVGMRVDWLLTMFPKLRGYGNTGSLLYSSDGLNSYLDSYRQVKLLSLSLIKFIVPDVQCLKKASWVLRNCQILRLNEAFLPYMEKIRKIVPHDCRILFR